MTNITSLIKPNEDIIESLKIMLDLAELGKLESIAMVGETKDELYRSVCGKVTSSTIGELEKLKTVLILELLE